MYILKEIFAAWLIYFRVIRDSLLIFNVSLFDLQNYFFANIF